MVVVTYEITLKASWLFRCPIESTKVITRWPAVVIYVHLTIDINEFLSTVLFSLPPYPHLHHWFFSPRPVSSPSHPTKEHPTLDPVFNKSNKRFCFCLDLRLNGGISMYLTCQASSSMTGKPKQTDMHCIRTLLFLLPACSLSMVMRADNIAAVSSGIFAGLCPTFARSKAMLSWIPCFFFLKMTCFVRYVPLQKDLKWRHTI